MTEDELVSRRQWIPRQRFLDPIGAANPIPGPRSTEMTLPLGAERGGFAALVAAGAAVAGRLWLYRSRCYNRVPRCSAKS